jgi:outer membrane protein TolC
VNRKSAGTVPAIDVLRAQVQQQIDQQRLIAAQADFERAKLSLARAVGLPLGQPFRIADAIPYDPIPPGITLDNTLALAYRQRSDYLAAEALVQGAELIKSAAQAGRLPTAGVDANYGVIGNRITETHGSFSVVGSVNIPIYQGGRVKAEVEQADTALQQRRAERDDLRGRIDNDVRVAFLDLQTSSQQVEVARSNIGLATQTLEQAQDRFAAGVSDNLEVVQAQQALAAANESYIDSLYAFNAAKATLARARGDAELSVTQYLKGKQP